MKKFLLSAAMVSMACAANAQNSSNAKHDFVDLGLTSGTLWATCNIGAEKPEDGGQYFAWGETVGYGKDLSDERPFNWGDYKWVVEGKSSKLFATKYTCADDEVGGCWYKDGKYVGSTVDGKEYQSLVKLLPEDDAAIANWGDDWCMPTKEQFMELYSSANTTSEWVTENGVMGCKFTSKKNGNTLFLPAGGFRHFRNINVENNGCYWSCMLDKNNTHRAYALSVYDGGTSCSASDRCDGRFIRPVRAKK